MSGKATATTKPSPSTLLGRALDILRAPNKKTAVIQGTPRYGEPSGAATVLQDVGGQGYSQAVAINASGESVGFSFTSADTNGPLDAVLWSSTGTATVLKDPGNARIADALDINNAGQSVGFYDVESQPGNTGSIHTVAALWSPTGKVTDLDKILGPSWSYAEALGINNVGDIVGQGAFDGGLSSFVLMHVGGASSDHYDLITSHVPVSTLAAHLGS